jgi:hypothetical protein
MAAALLFLFLVALALVLARELGEKGAWAKSRAASDRLRTSQVDAERRLYPDAGPYRRSA